MTEEASRLSEVIFRQIVADLFDRPVMGNLYRPHFVERMVVHALGEGFRLASADWAGWDIDHASGVRLEVKQSAARQSWTEGAPQGGRAARGVFDIRARTGHHDPQSGWVPAVGRVAQLYILAWHPGTDPVATDHRDPGQWRFYAVPAADLPAGKTVSVGVVERRWGPATGHGGLRDRVLPMVAAIPGRRAATAP